VRTAELSAVRARSNRKRPFFFFRKHDGARKPLRFAQEYSLALLKALTTTIKFMKIFFRLGLFFKRKYATIWEIVFFI
jgi:hypothetical protein